MALQYPTNPAPDQSSDIDKEPSRETISYGGYEARFSIGLHPIKRKLNLTYTKLLPAERNILESFLSSTEGRLAFLYQVPGDTKPTAWVWDGSTETWPEGKFTLTVRLHEVSDNLV